MRRYSSLIRLAMVFITLPQTIIGALLLGFYAIANKIDYIDKFPPNIDGCYIIHLNKSYDYFSLCLGIFVFIGNGERYPFCLEHEYGHYLLNIYTFWFYLPFIGIPSFVLYHIYKNKKDFQEKYYKLYTEILADKLGGVVRK